MKCLCCCGHGSNTTSETNATTHSTIHDDFKTIYGILIFREIPQEWQRYEQLERCLIPPKPYIDKNNKEWLCFFARKDSHNASNNAVSSYLYNIKNDMYIPFITNYKQQLTIDSENSRDLCKPIDNNYEFNDYVVDNSNHLLYMIEVTNGLMMKISIGILGNAKLIDSTFIAKQIPIRSHLKMTLSDNGKYIHILAMNQSVQYYTFNTQNNILTMVNDNIDKLKSNKTLNNYAQITDIQWQQQLQHHRNQCLKGKNENISLKIGDDIDVRKLTLTYGRYYAANIIDTQPKDDNTSEVSKKKGILVHYIGHTSILDEWIYVVDDGDDNIMCDCIGSCHASSEYHRIAAKRTQSKIAKYFSCNADINGLRFYNPSSILMTTSSSININCNVNGIDNYSYNENDSDNDNMKIFALQFDNGFGKYDKLNGYCIYHPYPYYNKNDLLIHGYMRTIPICHQILKRIYFLIDSH